MGDEQYPSLGFDPARGNVTTVRDLAKQMTDTGTYAKEAHEVLKSVEDKKDVWTGDAAKAFAGKLGELPKYLDDAASSLKGAGKALNTWSDQLDKHQQRARELEAEAKQAIADAKKADSAAEQATGAANTPVAYDTNDPAAARAAQQQAQSKSDAAAQANNAASDAWARVDDIRRKAQDLKDTWEDNAGTCADSLNDAADKAPSTGFWESIGDAFAGAGEWVMDHLGDIGDIGDIAGMVSAVAGALSFIPILAPVTGPIALAAGGVALVAHGADMVKEGKYGASDWVGLGADVLGVLPGVGAAAKGMSTATDSLQVADGLGTAASAGGRVFMQEAGQVAKPASMYESLGGKVADSIGGNADTIAKATHNTVSLGGQVPTAADKISGSETTRDIKTTAGYVNGGLAAGQTVGKWGDTGSSLGSLGSSLSSFARAVG